MDKEKLSQLIKQAYELNNELTAVLIMLSRYALPEPNRGNSTLVPTDKLKEMQDRLNGLPDDNEIALRKIEEYIDLMGAGFTQPDWDRFGEVKDWLKQKGRSWVEGKGFVNKDGE